MHGVSAFLVREEAAETVRRPPRRRPGLRAGATEGELSRYYSEFRGSGSPAWSFALRRPRATLLALVATIRLPSRTAPLSGSAGGLALHRALSRPVLVGAPVGPTGVSVLCVPPEPEDYVAGRRKQTLRRRVRAAEKRGITWRPIHPDERRAFLLLAQQAERAHPDPKYRIDCPSNEDLLDHDLWLAAFSAHGDPLLLSVTPTDGQWALLRYFRTLGRGPEHSDSRYLMCTALVTALSERGVRFLVDEWHPGEIPEGLRQFQRMVGFRIMRVVPRWCGSRPPSTEPSRRGPARRFRLGRFHGRRR